MIKLPAIDALNLTTPWRACAASFLFCFLFYTATYSAFTPRWETNDDVGMAMVTHGYGFAAQPSSYLVFSNMLWGDVVRSLPEIHGVLGYSVGMVLAQFFAMWLAGYSLLRLRLHPILTFAALVLVMVRPAVFPQFTTNSGLLVVGAILGIIAYTRHGGKWLLACSVLAAFLGYLIREGEFLLVLAVALPILPWKSILRRDIVIAAVVFIVMCGGARLYQDHKMQAPEWKEFAKLNAARTPYTDYSANLFLSQRPDILERYDFSLNDLTLVHNWFFADPVMAAPKKLAAMSTELGPISMQKGSALVGLYALYALITASALPLTLTAFFAFLTRPTVRIFLLAATISSVIFYTGLIGRPGAFRVYYPFYALALYMTHLVPPPSESWKLRARFFLMALAVVAAILQVAIDASTNQQQMRSALTEGKSISADGVYVWGDALPYEYLNPVLAPSPLRHQHFYALGVLTYAPFSYALEMEKAGKGLISAFLSDRGATFIAGKHQMEWMHIYCREHYKGRFMLKNLYNGEHIKMFNISCRPDVKYDARRTQSHTAERKNK